MIEDGGAEQVKGLTPVHDGELSPFAHISHPAKRAYLIEFARTQKKAAAAEAAGIHPSTPYQPFWKNDPEFQAAMEIARQMVADRVEDELLRRGVEGVERVKHTKDGDPLRHPNRCDCGHDRREYHPVLEPANEVSDRPVHGPCAYPGCDCEAFVMGYYIEHEYSDRLLELLAKAHAPERFGNKLEVRSLVAKVDLGRMPDTVVGRVAGGEPLEAVLASIIEEGGEEAERVRAALPGAMPNRAGEIVQGERGDDAATGGTPRPSPGEDEGLGEDL